MVTPNSSRADLPVLCLHCMFMSLHYAHYFRL